MLTKIPSSTEELREFSPSTGPNIRQQSDQPFLWLSTPTTAFSAPMGPTWPHRNGLNEQKTRGAFLVNGNFATIVLPLEWAQHARTTSISYQLHFRPFKT